MRALLLVGIGGALGSMGRYALGGWVLRHAGPGGFPWGTFAVNVLGCLAIGAFVGLATRQAWLGEPWRLLLVTGFLGGFTTFSAFGLETVALLRRGDTAAAALYVLGSVLVGLLAVWLGMKGLEGLPGRA